MHLFLAGAEHRSHAIAFRLQHLRELPPSREQRVKLLRGHVRNDAHLWADDIGEACEDVRVNAIRFGELPRRLRNVTHLAWIHDHHGQCRGRERSDGEQLVSAPSLPI